MKNKLLITVLLISILFTTIVYSAFSTQLNIDGEAIVRSDQDIRITDIRIQSQTNGAYETYNNKYNKDATFMYVTLPANSSITYEVDITNKVSNSYDVSSIQQLSNVNSNVDTIISLEVADIVNSNSTKSFFITISNNTSSEQQETLVYKYGFVKHINSYVVNTYDTPNSYIFNVPYTGIYKIELWGAQGGGAYYNYGAYLSPGYEKLGDYINGGKGSYTAGFILLKENLTLIIYVGGLGNDFSSVIYGSRPTGGYNGGGRGGYAYQIGAGGGGSTDVRLTSGSWNNFDSLKSRIMVAGAGGGTSNHHYTVPGGAGGGLNGYSGILNEFSPSHRLSTGGFQNEPGISGESANPSLAYFGIAADSDIGHGGGGGSGYYGAGGGGVTDGGVSSGAGGSSFISGHNGCDAIDKNSTSDNIIHTGQSLHYSGYKFTDTIMIDGAGCKWTDELTTECNGMPTHDGTSTMIGNTGNGYAKITFIERVFE